MPDPGVLTAKLLDWGVKAGVALALGATTWLFGTVGSLKDEVTTQKVQSQIQTPILQKQLDRLENKVDAVKTDVETVKQKTNVLSGKVDVLLERKDTEK